MRPNYLTWKEIGAPLGESLRLAYLGLLFHHLGNNTAALQFSQQALQLAQDLGARREQGYALTNLGHSLAGLKRLAEAAEAYRQALAVRRELGAPSRMMEPLAGLAGADSPFQLYLTCYRVLQARQDSRAPGLLQIAYDRLQAQAASINDKRLRCSFLENIPAHRELIYEFNR